MKLIADLIKMGWKPFRKLGNNYIPCNDPYYFSSVVGGKLCVVMKLKEKEIWVGLYQSGYPPTLLYPSLGITNPDIEIKLRTKTTQEIIDLA